MYRTRVLWLMLLAATLPLASCNGSSSKVSPLTGLYLGQLGSSLIPLGSPSDSHEGVVGPNGNGYFASSSEVVMIGALTDSGSANAGVRVLSADPTQPSTPSGDSLVNRGAMPQTIHSEVQVTTVAPDSCPLDFLSKLYLTLPQNLEALCLSMVDPATSFNGSVSAGQYQGTYYEGNIVVALSVTADGRFSGTDSVGCRIRGRLTPASGAPAGLYVVGASVTGASDCAGQVAGLGWTELGFNNSGLGTVSLLKMIAVNGAETQAFAVTLQQQ